MEFHELCPAHAAFPPLRCRVNVMAAQDVAHRDLIDLMAQVRQGSLDAPITPGRILLRHENDQLLHFIGDARSAPRFALMAAIELLGNQSVVPAHERLGRGDGRSTLSCWRPRGWATLASRRCSVS